VKTNGGRIEVSLPGVKLGVFDGRLEYQIYKGSSLIRQAIVAKTEQPAVDWSPIVNALKRATTSGRRVRC
jgi:hypothetical protein